jgi:hypothetical protein
MFPIFETPATALRGTGNLTVCYTVDYCRSKNEPDSSIYHVYVKLPDCILYLPSGISPRSSPSSRTRSWRLFGGAVSNRCAYSTAISCVQRLGVQWSGVLLWFPIIRLHWLKTNYGYIYIYNSNDVWRLVVYFNHHVRFWLWFYHQYQGQESQSFRGSIIPSAGV